MKILIILLMLPLQFHFLLNQYRAVNGEEYVMYSPALSRDAEERACWVDDNWTEVWEHYQETKKHLEFSEEGVNGENIAHDYSNNIDALQAWTLSPDHNDVLLGDYKRYGIGTCGDTKVLHFMQ